MIQINFLCSNLALTIFIFFKNNSILAINNPPQSKPSGGHFEIQASNYKINLLIFSRAP